MGEFQRVALAIVKNQREQVLMVQRAKKETRGGAVLGWAFPGGKIEEGETPAECAVRETFEETGNTIRAGETIASLLHPIFPVHIDYIQGILNNDAPWLGVTDPAIRATTWMYPQEIRSAITSPLMEDVAIYLGLPRI